MKIAVVGFLHPREDKRVMRTVRALSNLGEVTYLYWTEKKENSCSSNGVKYIPFLHKIQRGHPLREWNSRKKHEYEIINYLTNHEFDVVYIHHYATTQTLAPYKALKKKGTTIITDFHEYVPEEYLFGTRIIPRFFKDKIGNYLYKALLKLSDGAIFVSKYMQKNALKDEPDLKSLWFPNYGNFTINPYKKSERRREIVFVGKIQRRMEKEIDIIKKLLKNSFEFTILGGRSNFRTEKTNIIPFVPYEEMISYITKSAFSLVSFDVKDEKGRSLLNSIYSQPNKFYDSICAGTPVILDKRFEEMRSIVERDNTGLIIDRDNAEKSSELILNTWENGSKYNALLKNISERQENYCWDEKKEEQFLSFVLNTYKEAKKR